MGQEIRPPELIAPLTSSARAPAATLEAPALGSTPEPAILTESSPQPEASFEPDPELTSEPTAEPISEPIGAAPVTQATPALTITPAKSAKIESMSTKSNPPELAPVLTARPPQDFPTYSLSLSAGYSFSNLNATDSSTSSRANLHTSHDVLLSGAYEQDWSDEFNTYFAFSLQQLDFQASTNPEKTLSNTSKTLADFTLGAESALSSRVKIQYGGAYGDQLFLEGLNSSAIQVDALSVAAFWGGLSVAIFQKGSTEIALHGSGEFLFPTSSDTYTVHAGSEFSGYLSLKKNYGIENALGQSSSFEIDLGYGQRNENTSLMSLSESRVFAQLVFHFPIFESTGGRP